MMNTLNRRAALQHLAAAGAMLAGPLARAQAWPSRPIRLVVPYGTGGGPDILARLFAQEMAPAFGSLVVENKGGSGGNIGADAVAKSAPDGYTLLVTTTATHCINPALYPSMPYDPVRDFTPIGLIASTPLMLATAANSPYKSLAEVLAAAKAHEGQVSYASSGSGTMQHISGELMASMAGAKMTHIPYKGTSQMVPDVVSGRVSILFNSVASLAGLVRGGQLRPLAVTTLKRLPDWPDVPTMSEAGLPGFESSAWYAVFGPAGMPPEIVARLNRELQRVVDLPAIRERYRTLGLEPLKGPPQELGDAVKADLKKWTTFLRERNIKAEA